MWSMNVPFPTKKGPPYRLPSAFGSSLSVE
jgi:hypothetical protein